MAVASPSMLGFVREDHLGDRVGLEALSSSRMRSCSGPMPSIGVIAPCSTW